MPVGDSQKLLVTYKYRVKDAYAHKHLERYARAVNRVWNFCCDVQKQSERKWRSGRKTIWPTHFDLSKLCGDGLSIMLGIHSDSVNYTCRQFVASRNHRKVCPSYRSSSGGAKRSFGWIPFTKRGVRIESGFVVYNKQKFRFWESRELEGVVRSGAFIQDARGRWYITFQCEVDADRSGSVGTIGVDLGLKDLATLSNGTKIAAGKFFAQYEVQLGNAHRAKDWKRLRVIHAKIANSRRHYLHVESSKLVRNFDYIVVGDVSAPRLVKTKLAKSVYDCSWGAFRNMLRYKSARRRAVYVDVNEAWSTQTCSSCGAIPASSPKGKSGLKVRYWDCSDCGASHDRDVNAAQNILRTGLERQPPA